MLPKLSRNLNYTAKSTIRKRVLGFYSPHTKLMTEVSSFKNKIPLLHTNFQIRKSLVNTEIKLVNLTKSEILEKTFYFDTNPSIDEVFKTIEKEYDMLLDLSDQSIAELKQQLANEEYTPKTKNYIQEIDSILSKLKIKHSDPEYKEFLELFKEQRNLNELKRQVMFINSEIEALERTKTIIDRKVAFRLRIVLLIILSIIALVTGVFYHCIYNIDDLGWDLVEPTTYLFSSVVFLLCLFTFAKAQKNFYSTADLYYSLNTSLNAKRYLKYNFNLSTYSKLHSKRSALMKEIERQSRI